MNRLIAAGICIIVILFVSRSDLNVLKSSSDSGDQTQKGYKEVSGTVKKGETLFDIFKRYNLDLTELFKIREASAHIHRLKKVYPGRQYKIVFDDSYQINSFVYWIDDDNFLNIKRDEDGFSAEKITVIYERRIEQTGGMIKDNLIASIGEGRENLMLGLQLSDIFSWDIDFTSDIRNGDVFKIVAEGLYLDGEFRKYGDILSAEFQNNGKTYSAYRFEFDGKADYYDENGRSLKKAFLKAPLSFRRISSGYSKGRFHPVLKIYRPHHGLDYAAPAGTPVSAIGDGIVVFAGRKGQYGNLVILKHPNGYRTYYGHLSKLGSGIKNGIKVKQGEIIGNVGSTGIATGPHLHYEIRINNRPLNPLTLKIPKGEPVPVKLMADFIRMKDEMDGRITSITPDVFAYANNKKDDRI